MGWQSFDSNGILVEADDANTAPLLLPNAGGYIRQDSTGTIAKESGGNLATLVSTLDIAQGASASSTTGPMVQGRVDLSIPSSNDDLIQPLSLDQNRRLRVITDTEEIISAWDQDLPDAFNIHVANSGFNLTNQLTIDNVWE